MSAGESRLSATAWDALSPEHAKEFVRALAREARAGASRGSPVDNQRGATRAAARWEQLAAERLPYTVSTTVMVDVSGRMWTGMWMTWYQGAALSGSV